MGNMALLFLYITCLCAVVACGKGFQEEVVEVKPPIEQGRYTATLRSLNASRANVSGWVSINVSEGQFWVRVKMSGGKSKVVHAQYLHAGEACPDSSDDTNNDNVIDALEGHKVFQDILLPLDASLHSRMRGITEFPVMKQQGFYFYSRAASSKKLMDDLRAPLTYPEAMMRSLGSEEELDLANRTVVIYGIHDEDRLPSTVRTYGGYPAQHSLPIACGELEYAGPEEFNP